MSDSNDNPESDQQAVEPTAGRQSSDHRTPGVSAHEASLHTGIWSGSFQGLLWTQWLTAINDNVFRWFVIGVGKDQFTAENFGTLLVVGSVLFYRPVHPVCFGCRLVG